MHLKPFSPLTLLFFHAIRFNSASGRQPIDSAFLNVTLLSARDIPNLSSPNNFRTRQSIVWSCLATMFACTWVAIHPNLPDPRCSKWSEFKRRTAMMILTIFAPEFILIWALRQRLGARRIMKEYNSTVLGTDEENPSFYHDLRKWFRRPLSPHQHQKWTLSHGFYVQMGGFLFHEEATEGPIRALSFQELVDLIQAGLVDPPIITHAELCDKSKGDFFAKLFVVVQTTWFMVQCLVRWIVKLPVTELEIMTFSFTVLNIITYALWLEKPQNVAVGTCVQMKAQTTDHDTAMVHPTIDFEEDITDSHRPNLEHSPPALDGEPMEEHSTVNHFLHNRPPPSRVSAQVAITQSTAVAHRRRGRPRSPIWNWTFVTISIFPNALDLLGRVTLRAHLFNQLRDVVLGSTPTMGTKHIISIQTVRKWGSKETTVVSVIPGALTLGTFYAHETSSSDKKGRLILFVVASRLLFGGLHLVPWKFAFPTHIESVVWRLSALYIMVNPVLLSFPLALYAFLLDRFPGRSELRSTAVRWLRWLKPPVRVITIAIPLYILARSSLIVLAFTTTLRSLGPDVYKDIPWNSYIPHI